MKPQNIKDTEHTRSRYNLTAPIYDLMEWIPEKLLYHNWRRELWSQVEGEELLEIGIGTGKNVPYYPPSANITGIDLSENMLVRARKTLNKHPNSKVETHIMDSQALQFEAGKFENVIATFVFCSVPDPLLGLREARRVTRKGGRLILIEHMRADNAVLAWIMEKIDPVLHWFSGYHIARKTVNNIVSAGWEIIQIKNLSPFGIFKMVVAEKG